MPRIRTIKPEFPQSETIGRLSRDARLLFIQLWTIVDDDGRARAASRMLASLLYPYDDDAPGLIGAWLDELEGEYCIRRYEIDGKRYLDIPHWNDHQKIDHKSTSKIPPYQPSPFPREPSRPLANLSEGLAPDLGPSILDLGKDQDSRAVAVATRPKRTADRFDEFWSAYPKRDGANPKEPARKKFIAAVKSGVDASEIIAGARAYASAESEKIGTPYIAQAMTWLNQRRWTDYAPRVVSTGPPLPPVAGLPSNEDLEKRYADRGKTEAIVPEATGVLACGPGIRRQERSMGLDRGGYAEMPSLGAIFSKSGMEAVCHQTDREEANYRDDDADGMAGVVR